LVQYIAKVGQWMEVQMPCTSPSHDHHNETLQQNIFFVNQLIIQLPASNTQINRS